jgi:hypothetical protein
MYVLEKYKLSDEGDCMGQTDLDDIYMLLEEMK